MAAACGRMAAARGRMDARGRVAPRLLAEAGKVSRPVACPGSPGKAAQRRYAPDRATATIFFSPLSLLSTITQHSRKKKDTEYKKKYNLNHSSNNAWTINNNKKSIPDPAVLLDPATSIPTTAAGCGTPAACLLYTSPSPRD